MSARSPGRLPCSVVTAVFLTAASTDAGIALQGSDFPHPRLYGTYPRKLRRYVLDGGAITMAQAVRSSTSLPAQIAGLASPLVASTAPIAPPPPAAAAR